MLRDCAWRFVAAQHSDTHAAIIQRAEARSRTLCVLTPGHACSRGCPDRNMHRFGAIRKGALGSRGLGTAEVAPRQEGHGGDGARDQGDEADVADAVFQAW